MAVTPRTSNDEDRPGSDATPDLRVRSSHERMAWVYHPAQIAARTLRGATVGTAAETILSFCTTARAALKVFSTRAGVQSTRQQPGIDFDRLLDSDETLYVDVGKAMV